MMIQTGIGITVVWAHQNFTNGCGLNCDCPNEMKSIPDIISFGTQVCGLVGDRIDEIDDNVLKI